MAKRLFPDLPFVNADERAQQLSPGFPERVAVTAGRLTLITLQELIARRQDFAWETTLSGNVHHRVLRSARSSGYRLGMFYIGLRSATLASIRVQDRVAKGGHNVPKTEVERRYGRSLDSLRAALASTDIGYVVDNSRSGPSAFRRIMRVRNGTVDRLDEPLPEWLQTAWGGKPPRLAEQIAED